MLKGATLDPTSAEPGLKTPGGERGVKRYNLVIPEALFDEVQRMADEEHTTVVELIRRFIKFGLIASELSRKPDSAVILREGSRDREIMFLV